MGAPEGEGGAYVEAGRGARTVKRCRCCGRGMHDNELSDQCGWCEKIVVEAVIEVSG